MISFTKLLQTAVISGQGESSVVQHHVKGEYQPPTYGYSSSYGYAPPPADTKRDLPGEALMHKTSDYTEQIIVEPLVKSVTEWGQVFTQGENMEKEVERPVEEKEFTAPFTAWNPAK